MLVPACMSMYSFPSYYPRCGRSGFCNIHLLCLTEGFAALSQIACVPEAFIFVGPVP